MIRADQMPYPNPLGFTYDSGDFPFALDTALQQADWAGFDDRRQASLAKGKLRGIGLACATEPARSSLRAAAGPMRRCPNLPASGSVPRNGLIIDAGSGDSGQGHATAFRQMVDHLLGWQGRVTICTGDTRDVAQGTGTFGSRTMGAMGAALDHCATAIMAQALPHAADHLEVAAGDLEIAAGTFRVTGTDRAVTLQALVAATETTFDAQGFVAAQAGTFPNGAHVAEVEVDPETGTARLLRYTIADEWAA